MTTSPRLVLLFTGHRIDAPGRTPARFPSRLEAAAATRIGATLDDLQAGPHDFAFTQGASGGDLLFAEACLARHVPLQLMLPLRETEFVAQSILTSQDGEQWRTRFTAVKARLDRPALDAPDALGPLVADAGNPSADAFVRGNRWLLDAALAHDHRGLPHGASSLVVIALWDGADGDGPGGTRDLMETAQSHGARVIWIDTRTLDASSARP